MDSMESRAANAAKELQTSFDSISLSGPESGEITGTATYRVNATASCYTIISLVSGACADGAAAGDAGGSQDQDPAGQEADDMFNLDDL
jgi:hypothetical protein